MLSVFWGENRLDAEKAVKRTLGTDYEVFEGENLTVADLPSIFRGTSLFGTDKRQILLKELGENKEVWEKIPDYLGTEHDVVIWESKLDKRSAVYKAMNAIGVKMQEFPAKKNPDANAVFNILDMALRNGLLAVKMVEKIELGQDPYMFFGLLVTQATKKLEYRAGNREKRLLKELAELDVQMKTTSVEPWLLVKSFLLRVSEF